MTRSEAALRPLPVQIARNFALWLVLVPGLMLLLSPIGAYPLPDAKGWQRIAMFAVPVVLVGAVIDALADRWASRGSRAYGRGFAVALMLFVFASTDRVAGGVELPKLLKGLLIVPIVGAFMAIPQWTRDKYLTPPEPK